MIDVRDVEAAAERLSDVIVDTPLLWNAELDALAGGRVWLKPELFQEIGSFKIRGAYNLMSQLPAEEAARGVVAWSSGNHAQGVALAGRLLGIPAAIVMPEDAPAAKLENTRRLGGEVITYDRYTGDREAIAREIAAERGAALVPSYEHADIIAGQGTVGLEIAEQAMVLGQPPEQVLIPCSGGGLTAGCAVALADRVPGVRVHPVEPEFYDDTTRSLALGERVRVGQGSPSICDSLLVGSPGKINFDIMRELTAPGLVVTDDEVREAMRFAFRQLKLVVEPGGAAGLAAVLAGKLETRGRVTAVVLSGGNVDRGLFAEIQAEPA
jgi:threonine dehydratase